MRAPPLRSVLPWLIGLSLAAGLASLVLAINFGLAARTAATQTTIRELAAQADAMAREIEADITLFDLALHEAAIQARLPAPRDAGQAQPRAFLLEHPLTARYIGFMNVLNEVGDVIADPRTNVSRPVNFAGRDYFQEHLKNSSDNLVIGRPFATAPNQHASIPISRRLNTPDGGFDGVVVAGVRLAWLSDLISEPMPGRPRSVTIRRDDGLILMRSPFDADAIGRGGPADAAWRDYLRTGVTTATNDLGGIRLFRRIGAPALILELAVDRAFVAADDRAWLIWLPSQALILLACVAGLSFGGLAVTPPHRSNRGGCPRRQ